jgi:predicted RNase H-like nuclease (RuvC/YqgF family)
MQTDDDKEQTTEIKLELVQTRAYNEGLQKLLEEKDKRIEDLTMEVEDLRGFAHYFKTVEVKQLEAPKIDVIKPWWKFW